MAFYSNGKISIPNVTGDIVITANAIKSAVNYTDLTKQDGWTWAENARLNSSGTTTTLSGTYSTDYIPIKQGDIIYIKGLDIRSTSNGNATISSFTTNKTLVANGTCITNAVINAGYISLNGDVFVVQAGYYNMGFNDDAVYQRLCGILMDGYTLDDVIITVNEEIE